MIGFPGIAGTDAPQVTNGAVSGFVADPRLQDNRAFINSDVAIAHGNSGGLAADSHGRLIGVPTAKRSEGTDSFSQLRPIHLAADLIDSVRKGEEYTSPFVTPAAAEAIDVESMTFATTGRAQFSPNCRDRGASGRPASAVSVLSFTVDYSGFPNGHQDVLVRVFDVESGNLVGAATTADDYPIEFTGSSCLAVSVPIADADGRPAEVQPGQAIALKIDVGPNYELNMFRDRDQGVFVVTL